MADPLLPAAALAIVFASSAIWARRRQGAAAGWAIAGLALVILVAVAVLGARAPGGCPA